MIRYLHKSHALRCLIFLIQCTAKESKALFVDIRALLRFHVVYNIQPNFSVKLRKLSRPSSFNIIGETYYFYTLTDTELCKNIWYTCVAHNSDSVSVRTKILKSTNQPKFCMFPIFFSVPNSLHLFCVFNQSSSGSIILPILKLT